MRLPHSVAQRVATIKVTFQCLSWSVPKDMNYKVMIVCEKYWNILTWPRWTSSVPPVKAVIYTEDGWRHAPLTIIVSGSFSSLSLFTTNVTYTVSAPLQLIMCAQSNGQRWVVQRSALSWVSTEMLSYLNDKGCWGCMACSQYSGLEKPTPTLFLV